MSLTVGARLSVYEVTATIGEGGMREVYRARDTKLNRERWAASLGVADLLERALGNAAS